MDESCSQLESWKNVAEKRDDALQKLESLKQEAAKGTHADHGLMTKLADGIVGLVPEALKSLAKAFGAPVLTEWPGRLPSICSISSLANEVHGETEPQPKPF